MKKLLICMFAIATLGLVSCNKDDDKDSTPDYAADFIGNYILSVNATMAIPVYGDVDLPVGDMEASVVRKGTGNEVTLTVMNQTLDGYCNENGLHVDPFTVNTNLMSVSVALTVTVPTVAAPVNNTVSGTAAIAATIMGYSATGTAIFTGVKQ